jgi:hypothetical protein
MIQTNYNQHRHATRQVMTPVFVRAGFVMAAGTIAWLTMLVACRKGAAP